MRLQYNIFLLYDINDHNYDKVKKKKVKLSL
jgi:hypothetical protein